MKNRCATLCALLVATATAAPSGTVIAGGYLFDEGEAPRCTMAADGHMLVQYNDAAAHPSWKCEHNLALTECTCIMNHPSHHFGGCKQIVHRGTTHSVHGDCTDGGLNFCTDADITCLNGGTATGRINGCSCTCAAGFTGDHCALRPPPSDRWRQQLPQHAGRKREPPGWHPLCRDQERGHRVGLG